MANVIGLAYNAREMLELANSPDSPLYGKFIGLLFTIVDNKAMANGAETIPPHPYTFHIELVYYKSDFLNPRFLFLEAGEIRPISRYFDQNAGGVLVPDGGAVSPYGFNMNELEYFHLTHASGFDFGFFPALEVRIISSISKDYVIVSGAKLNYGAMGFPSRSIPPRRDHFTFMMEGKVEGHQQGVVDLMNVQQLSPEYKAQLAGTDAAVVPFASQAMPCPPYWIPTLSIENNETTAINTFSPIFLHAVSGLEKTRLRNILIAWVSACLDLKNKIEGTSYTVEPDWDHSILADDAQADLVYKIKKNQNNGSALRDQDKYIDELNTLVGNQIG